MSKSSYGVGTRITTLALSTIMALTMSGCSLNKRNNENKVNNTTIVTTINSDDYNAGNVTTTEPETTTTEPEIDTKQQLIDQEIQKQLQEQFKDITYDELMQNFNESIEKYEPSLQKYLTEVFSIAYKNADELSTVFSPLGFPDKEAFLNEKVVKPLEKLDFIKIVTEMDDDYFELYQKYQSSRYVAEENGIYVFIVGWNYNEQVQVILEEILHAWQDYLMKVSLSYSVFEILSEGEANLWAWVLAFGNINNDSLDFFYYKDTDADLFQMYGSGHHDHSIASKYYAYLLALTDYATLTSLRYNNADMSIVTDKISQDYGIDGKKLLQDMDDVMVDAASNIHDARTDIMLRVEKTCNECMLQKVSKNTTKEQTMDCIRLYRFLNIQLGTRHLVHNDASDKYKDVTDKDPNLSRVAIENELFEQAEKYGILDEFVTGIPKDEETRKTIFKTIVDSPRPKYDGFNFYSPDIFTSKISYNQNKGTLTLENQNGSGCVIDINTKKVEGNAYVFDLPSYNGYTR